MFRGNSQKALTEETMSRVKVGGFIIWDRVLTGHKGNKGGNQLSVNIPYSLIPSPLRCEEGKLHVRSPCLLYHDDLFTLNVSKTEILFLYYMFWYSKEERNEYGKLMLRSGLIDVMNLTMWFCCLCNGLPGGMWKDL